MQPTLVLEKPHGEVIGALGHAFGLKLELKYNEVSEGSFQYPKRANGKRTPFYDDLVRDKTVRLDPLGVFTIAETEADTEGEKKVKTVSIRSLEYELSGKKTVFAAGTYNFWNPADRENTVLGMVLENAPNWQIGYVSPALIGRYRTFDDTDDYIYSFLQGTAQDSYGCVILYDTYYRTVNAYDLDEPVEQLPIYLSYQNLIKQGKIKELDEMLVTKLYVQGAEDVDIRPVNPTGDNYIYNLDYYVENGDLPETLASKWMEWQNTILARQSHYTSLVSLRNAAIGRQAVERARLTDLQNKLATLDNTRATFLQMQVNVSSGDETWQYFEDRLNETAVEYTELETKIASQKTLLSDIATELAGYQNDIAAVNDALRFRSYFTQDEQSLLDHYFREDDFTDNTFAVYDVDVSGDDSFRVIESASVQFHGVVWVDVPCDGGHRMAAVSGGTVTASGTDYTVTGNIRSGTIDHKDGQVVCSLCIGSGALNGESFPGGNLTIAAKSGYDDDALLDGMAKKSSTITSADGSVSHTTYSYTGDASFQVTEGAFYFTRNATEYQRYIVAQELYDYASNQHKLISRPNYEFEIESGNLIFDQKFKPFRDALKLGCACYLQLDSGLCLSPILIEVHLNFDSPGDFSLVFANQFRRPDNVNTLKDAISDAVSAAKSFDSSKLSYGENKNTTTWVKELIQSGYDAALSQIKSGKDNLVTIDKAGIKVDSTDGTDKILLNNGMIALVDKRTNTVNLAMGHFLNRATGTDFVGILADIIGGTLLAGQNLIIECPDPNGGVMQFKVDSSGVILNNGRMYMRTEKGAMGFDANHGFFAGTTDLFETTDTGYVHPVCVDENGQLILDSDGFPVDTNVWFGIDGKVYIRGNIYANDGVFNGTVYARSGEFKGVVQASDFLDSAGNSMMTPEGKFDADYLDLMGINVKNSNGETVISIDENGIKFSAAYPPIKYQYSSNNTDWHDTQASGDKYRRESFDGGVTWGTGYQFVGTDGSNASVPSYIKRTYIDATTIKSPSIEANEFNVYPYDKNDYTGSYNIYGIHEVSGQQFHMFAIEYDGRGTAPYIYVGSPAGGYIQMNKSYNGWEGVMDFYGTIDFSNANVTGLYLTFS